VINRYGFNSHGHEAARQRLWDRLASFQWWHGPLTPAIPKSLHKDRLLGVNLGKNKSSPAESHQDYMDGIEKLGKFADYLVINISSPNTPGLRNLQARKPIQELLNQVPHQTTL
jgi:dihydroorotate dehydrogenase